MTRAIVAVMTVLGFACLEARAARPMITDDARIVDAKACQVESWVRRNAHSTETWALPACNPFGFAELTFGGARMFEDGTSRFTDQVLQAKTLFKPYEPGGWGVGLGVGTVRRPAREHARGWPGDYYTYVPISFAAGGNDDRVIHVNVGAARHRDEGRTIGTWGVGTELRASPRLYFIPEIFGNDRGRPFYQAGLRYWVLPDRMQVDATFGNRLVSDRAERWFSIGVRLLSPPFLP